MMKSLKTATIFSEVIVKKLTDVSKKSCGHCLAFRFVHENTKFQLVTM